MTRGTMADQYINNFVADTRCIKFIDVLRYCHVVNIEFTGWVYIQNLQHDIQHFEFNSNLPNGTIWNQRYHPKDHAILA